MTTERRAGKPARTAGPGTDPDRIPEELLRQYGARLVRLRKGQTVFEQGDPADQFCVVGSGQVRMVVLSGRGREFTQGYFREGESFGEPPFFAATKSPASAEAVEESTVWKCPRESFLRLLREHPDIHLGVTRTLSRRLIYKAMMLGEIAVEEAEHRLATLIRYIRRSQAPAPGAPWRVPFTRQQLADMTGLRVETVIRTVKAMESRGALRIVGGRIAWDEEKAARIYADP